jgi:hypothetical protein
MTSQAESKRGEIIPGADLTSALLTGTEIWINAQVEILSAMEASIADWTRRRHEAFGTWSRSAQKICECRDPVDLVQTQQDWLCDAIRMATLDIRALAGDTATLTRKMTAGFAKPADSDDDALQRRGGKPEVGERRPLDRVAAE